MKAKHCLTTHHPSSPFIGPQVIIKVIEPLDTEVLIKNNLIQVEVVEGTGEQELKEVETVGDVSKICITDVTEPSVAGTSLEGWTHGRSSLHTDRFK